MIEGQGEPERLQKERNKKRKKEINVTAVKSCKKKKNGRGLLPSASGFNY